MSDPVSDPVSDRVTYDHDWVMAAADEVKATGATQPRAGRDPINQPMINNWLEAMGNANPRFTAGEAPPSMAQVWTMKGLNPPAGEYDPLHAMMSKLTEAGFTGVLGTNCTQHYDRTLRVGEKVSVTTEIESVVGPKTTGVGEGYFVTSRNVWSVTGPDAEREQVATMTFRVLKFKPGPRKAAGPGEFVLHPTRNRDTEFFWQGTAAGELRIQQCEACGVLRHPPGPTCPSCLEFSRGYVVASGRGTVFSYVVHRHPQIPGHELPVLLALVDLEEGVRMVATVECIAPDDLEIGMPVEVGFRTIDDGLTLPVWRPTHTVVEGAGGRGRVEAPPTPTPALNPSMAPSLGDELPAWSLPITPTLVISTALATRDFQDVHHDVELARSYGSKDIFVNILTSNGLVERYVSEYAGHDVRIRSIAIRLGAPAYPGDTLAFSGAVSAVEGNTVTVDVVGAVSLGSHITGQVTMELAENGASA